MLTKVKGRAFAITLVIDFTILFLAIVVFNTVLARVIGLIAAAVVATTATTLLFRSNRDDSSRQGWGCMISSTITMILLLIFSLNAAFAVKGDEIGEVVGNNTPEYSSSVETDSLTVPNGIEKRPESSSTATTVKAPADKPASSTTTTVKAPADKPASSTTTTVKAPADKPASSTTTTVKAPADKPASSTTTTVKDPADKPASSTTTTVKAPDEEPVIKAEDNGADANVDSLVADKVEDSGVNNTDTSTDGDITDDTIASDDDTTDDTTGADDTTVSSDDNADDTIASGDDNTDDIIASDDDTTDDTTGADDTIASGDDNTDDTIASGDDTTDDTTSEEPVKALDKVVVDRTGSGQRGDRYYIYISCNTVVSTDMIKVFGAEFSREKYVPEKGIITVDLPYDSVGEFGLVISGEGIEMFEERFAYDTSVEEEDYDDDTDDNTDTDNGNDGTTDTDTDGGNNGDDGTTDTDNSNDGTTDTDNSNDGTTDTDNGNDATTDTDNGNDGTTDTDNGNTDTDNTDADTNGKYTVDFCEVLEGTSTQTASIRFDEEQADIDNVTVTCYDADGNVVEAEDVIAFGNDMLVVNTPVGVTSIVVG